MVAVDNEQYIAWVKARWGVVLKGGEGFRAIGALLGSRVEYVRGDALTLRDTGERFDVIFCFGILHRVENPLGLMRALGERLAPGGRLLVETYGIAHDGRVGERAIEVQQRGGIYPGDEFVYWGFGAGGLTALAGLAGFAEATVEATPTIDGIRACWAHSCVPARDQAAGTGAAAAAARDVRAVAGYRVGAQRSGGA